MREKLVIAYLTVGGIIYSYDLVFSDLANARKCS